MIFSTSTRVSFRFTPIDFSTLAAMPVDSPIRPSRICSVPTKLWPASRCADKQASVWWQLQTFVTPVSHCFPSHKYTLCACTKLPALAASNSMASAQPPYSTCYST